MKDENFDHDLNSLELNAWKSFKQVIYNFLGSKKARIMPMLCKTCWLHIRSLVVVCH